MDIKMLEKHEIKKKKWIGTNNTMQLVDVLTKTEASIKIWLGTFNFKLLPKYWIVWITNFSINFV